MSGGRAVMSGCLLVFVIVIAVSQLLCSMAPVKQMDCRWDPGQGMRIGHGQHTELELASEAKRRQGKSLQKLCDQERVTPAPVKASVPHNSQNADEVARMRDAGRSSLVSGT